MSNELENALAIVANVQKSALLQVVTEGDDWVAKIDAALAMPAIAQSKVGDVVKRAKDQYIVMCRSALATALSEGYGIDIEQPVVLPGDILAIPAKALTKLEFLSLFTADERAAIKAARATDAVIDDFFDLLDAAQDVRLDNDLTEQGVLYLEAEGLIGAGRAAEILG